VLHRALETAEASRKAQAEAERQSQQEEQRKREKEANVRRTVEEEQRRQREEEEARRKRAEAEAKHLAEERQRREAEAKRRAEKDERRRAPAFSNVWPPSRPVFAAGSLIGLMVLGVLGVRLFIAPTAPVAPPTPTPVPVEQTPTPTPEPVPTQPPDTPLSPARERTLRPKDTFRECSNCPQMIVVPAGSFMMGSPRNERGRNTNEGPRHAVTFARPFAVGRFELTFDEWDGCVADGGCNGYKPSDRGWGRGRQPVINVSWADAKAYVAWLSKKTGKDYRLLTEAEYEYATRAGTQTAYPWGDDVGKNNANQWGSKQTAPVGSFAANAFGLYDMVGNVWAWTEDCYHDSYNGAPADGSAWTNRTNGRVVRGGAWLDPPVDLRSANRFWFTTDVRYGNLGFRVGRTLLPP
jgi:formylglycine-generating enzyme required for sulfatase activity